MDLQEEISTEVRRDQLISFYKKNKKLISNISFVVLLAVAGYFFYKTRQDEARVDAAKSLYAAMHQSNSEEALKYLENIAKKTGYSYADLSKFYGAYLFEKTGSYENARHALLKLIDESSHKTFKNIARLRIIRLNIDAGKNFEEAEILLTSFQDPKSPWFFIAQELEASLKLAQGKNKEARKVLSTLAQNDEAPFDIKNRASFILATI